MVFCKEEFVVLRWEEFFWLGRFAQWCERINRKVSIIGVLLFEVIFGFYFWIAVLENIYETIDNLLYLIPCKLRTYPDDETGYFGHNGLPPGGPQTTFNPIL
ncbi:MAG: hypothetical protein C4549_07995 [Deltaproteobacteria bacterium]|nr:MAG: hypothetical protein C4549_07995 [Deltaproteobacteria bacterium]